MRVKRLASWRLVLMSLVALALFPSGAQAFSKAIWGSVERNGVNQFPLYHQLGVRIYEADLDWAQVAPQRPHDATDPSDPAYQWPATLAYAIAQARLYHMQVLLQLVFTPRWANHGRAQNVPPATPATYGAFAKAAAREYPSVYLWMIWGEPDRQANFAPTRTVAPYRNLDGAQAAAPHLYARLIDSAYGALKSVSRRSLVIGGSTYTSGDTDTRQWIKNLRLPNGRPPRMDMYAHNPFGYRKPSLSASGSPLGEVQFTDLSRLARWIDQYLHRGMPIFLSEYTIPTAPDREFPFWVEPKVAASWITDALRLSRRWHRIYALGWIHVYDDPPESYGGLFTAEGKPKPLFYAFEHG